MSKTHLSKYFEMTNPGEIYATYTCDEWQVPEAGAEIWCSGWRQRKTIKPHGDGYHVDVGGSCYHCDELMEILMGLEHDGYTWGIDGVSQRRRQQINGNWKSVEISPYPKKILEKEENFER